MVGEKLENNVACFYMAHVNVHLLIQSFSFYLSILSLSQENLLSQEEVADSLKKAIRSNFQNTNKKNCAMSASSII